MDNKRYEIKKKKVLRFKDPFGIVEFSINIKRVKIKEKWILPLLVFSSIFLLVAIIILIYIIIIKFR